MAKFIVTRPGEWMNMARRYRIYVDEQKIGTVSNNEIKEFDIAPGIHTFKAKVDWCGSKDISFYISEGETKTIQITSFGYKYHFILITACIFVLHFILYFFFGIDYVVWALAPFMPIILYFITFGRNRYLAISEKS